MSPGLFAHPLDVVIQDYSFGAQHDLDYALTLLTAIREGAADPAVRIYQPVKTAAFGQRDVRLPGFERAKEICRDAGYEPLVRKSGGRVALYGPGSVVVDHIERSNDAIVGAKQRYADFGDVLCKVLERLDIDARVGELPGEYCSGEFSVHGVAPDGRKAKLIGTAQRVISGAWLISAIVVVQNSEPIREVATAVYEALGLDLDPGTIGAADEFAPDVTPTSFIEELIAEYGERTDVVVR